jgi:hypothetical protein
MAVIRYLTYGITKSEKNLESSQKHSFFDILPLPPLRWMNQAFQVRASKLPRKRRQRRAKPSTRMAARSSRHSPRLGAILFYYYYYFIILILTVFIPSRPRTYPVKPAIFPPQHSFAADSRACNVDLPLLIIPLGQVALTELQMAAPGLAAASTADWHVTPTPRPCRTRRHPSCHTSFWLVMVQAHGSIGECRAALQHVASAVVHAHPSDSRAPLHGTVRRRHAHTQSSKTHTLCSVDYTMGQALLATTQLFKNTYSHTCTARRGSVASLHVLSCPSCMLHCVPCRITVTLKAVVSCCSQ